MNELKNDSKELKKYECFYCGHKFVQYVGTYNGVGKHNNGSDQVKCPKCTNFLKTWE